MADLRHVEGIGDVTLAKLTALVTVVNLNAPEGTADHLRLEPEKYRNREVMVFVTGVAILALITKLRQFVDRESWALASLTVAMLGLALWMLLEGALAWRRLVAVHAGHGRP